MYVPYMLIPPPILTQFRVDQDVSRQAAAEAAGISVHTLISMETGRRRFTPEVQAAILVRCAPGPRQPGDTHLIALAVAQADRSMRLLGDEHDRLVWCASPDAARAAISLLRALAGIDAYPVLAWSSFRDARPEDDLQLDAPSDDDRDDAEAIGERIGQFVASFARKRLNTRLIALAPAAEPLPPKEAERLAAALNAGEVNTG